jgi:predicted RNA-binding Zn ribbon-like protein
VREWMREWIARWRAAPRADYTAELRRLNALLARAACHRELAPSRSGLQLSERWRVETADALIAPSAARAASLVSEVAPALVKRCAGAGCSLWFVDRTKAHKRIFCSASACGNRAKVAAFRKRRREAQA